MKDWQPDDRGAGRRLLLVEDEPLLRRLVKLLLETGGFDVTDAGSSAEALRVLSKLDVDLLITDIQMPGMNGLELARAVRVERPRMPIVFVSALPPAAFRDFTGPRCSFVEKPFSGDRLLAIVRDALAAQLPAVP